MYLFTYPIYQKCSVFTNRILHDQVFFYVKLQTKHGQTVAFCADIECLDMAADLGSVKNNRMLDESAKSCLNINCLVWNIMDSSPTGNVYC